MLIWPFIECNTSGLCPGVHQEDSKGVPPLVVVRGSYPARRNTFGKYIFDLMKEMNNFDKAIILSGDGDFLPVLKYLKACGKGITILSRGPRTAREIRQFAGSDFRDFTRLERILKFDGK
jgi:Protein of unknown function DUF88.